MKHIPYVMVGSDKAPAGDGNTASWFEYYKWNADGETYVPVRHPFIEAEEGDFLWFVLDSKVLGGVPILRAETPSLPVQIQELWFDASQIVEVDLCPAPPAHACEQWFNSHGASLLSAGRIRKKE